MLLVERRVGSQEEVPGGESGDLDKKAVKLNLQ